MAKFAESRRWCHGAMTFVVTAGLAQFAIADSQTGGGYQHMWGGGMSMMFLGPFMMIVFLAVIVVIAVLAARWLLPASGSASSSGSSARTILDERFARGEIDAEEYRARCAELGK
ncbi:MAG: SHOCT domain-containing protein [Proteobacteria bacterium]|nr:SHOCT domain-containing protein [Pseudomonadota bacterium]